MIKARIKTDEAESQVVNIIFENRKTGEVCNSMTFDTGRRESIIRVDGGKVYDPPEVKPW